MKALLRSAAMILAVVLSGCAGFFGRTPPDLYRLSAVRAFPPALERRDVRLLVLRPRAAPGLDTERIALTRLPLALDYFAASAWPAPLPRLVQRAVVLSFENSGAVTAGDPERIGLDPNFLLASEISHFEAEYRAPTGPPLARVSLKVWLVRRHGRRDVASASFTERKEAAANDVPHIVLALDQALDVVAKKIVLWIANDPALPAGR
jgi:cholesterol transport system auxiliary component